MESRPRMHSVRQKLSCRPTVITVIHLLARLVSARPSFKCKAAEAARLGGHMRPSRFPCIGGECKRNSFKGAHQRSCSRKYGVPPEKACQAPARCQDSMTRKPTTKRGTPRAAYSEHHACKANGSPSAPELRERYERGKLAGWRAYACCCCCPVKARGDAAARPAARRRFES